MEEKLIYDPVRVEVIEVELPNSILDPTTGGGGGGIGDTPNEEDNN